MHSSRPKPRSRSRECSCPLGRPLLWRRSPRCSFLPSWLSWPLSGNLFCFTPLRFFVPKPPVHSRLNLWFQVHVVHHAEICFLPPYSDESRWVLVTANLCRVKQMEMEVMGDLIHML